MGPGIIIPLVIVVIVIPVAFSWARKTFKDGPSTDDSETTVPGARLTSNALRELPTPEWRVVYEVAPDKLGGVEHVLIGPPGIYAIRTSMDPVPDRPDPHGSPDAQAIARSAIERGDLDDALRRCAMSSDALISVHWAVPRDDDPLAVEVLPGQVAVDGRRLTEWCAQLAPSLASGQVDLAWQTVTTAIGRPDPLA